MTDTLSIFKIGGKVIDERNELHAFLRDFAGIPGNKILVHGGGKWVSDMSQRLGVDVKMTGGRRITNKETLDVVTMVLPGLANKNIVALLQKYGCNAIGLTGADGNMILADKRPVKDGLDFGYVGDVRVVNVLNIQSLLQSGFIPVFTAMTHDGNGQLLNTNADTIASSLAVNLAENSQVELFYCFEKIGVLRDLSDDRSLIQHIHPGNYQQLQDSKVIHSGMIPKIDNAFEAIKKGVRRIHICHYRDIRKLGMGNTELGTIITM
jgi:acetylglutamate kinase